MSELNEKDIINIGIIGFGKSFIYVLKLLFECLYISFIYIFIFVLTYIYYFYFYVYIYFCLL